MIDYRTALIKLIDKLSDMELERIYLLAEYIYIYVEGGGKA